MKNKSIAKQLFIVTFIVMTIMISIILLVQYLFFNMFYTSWKINELNNNMDKFSQRYLEENWNYYNYSLNKQNFFEKNNAEINIFNQKGESIDATLWQSQPWYYVTCTTENEEEYYFIVNESEILTQLSENEIEIGATFEVYGNIIKDNHIEPLLMNNNESSTYLGFAKKDNKNVPYFGETVLVTNVRNAAMNETNSYLNPFLTESLTLEPALVTDSWSDRDFMLLTNSSLVEQLYSSKEIKAKNGESYTLTLSASIQPIDEAATALASYYPYFFVFVLITSLFLAWIYSKKVAKPLLKINHTASLMANLDFEKRLDTTAKNEFGSLSESLNTLSGNLDKSLADLNQANQKLLEDIKEKEELEASRKEFVANVSHELKTPLGVMLCYVESLQDNISSEKTKEYYDVLKGEINKMNVMALQMLDLSKAESGDIKLNISKLNIKDMLDDILVLYSFQAQERGLTLDIRGDYADVSADFTKIEQVCTNLIGNAVRHSLLKSSIRIIGKIKDGKNRISIVNNCEPITQTKAQKLWERFYKADKSHKESGTGLGLSIVAAILDMHGVEYGVIAHENSIEFYFELELV